MLFIIRLVDEDVVNVHLIGFRTANESTRSLIELLLKMVNDNNFDIMNFRGQSYNNGANMRGLKIGVQFRILAFKSKVTVIPCDCNFFKYCYF